MVLRRLRISQSAVTIHSVALRSSCGCHPAAESVSVSNAAGMIVPVSGIAMRFVRMNCGGNVPK